MAPRRTRKVSADGHSTEQLNEMRQKKGALFIQQFEKDAQDRITEMVSKMEQMLATVDRVFKVELMKMPPALQNTLLKDLMNADETSAGEVTIAITNESPEMHQPFTRKISGKRVKISDGAPKRIQGLQTKRTAEPTKKATKTRSLVTSNSTGTLRCASTTTAKRTVARVAKTSDQSAMAASKHRPILLSCGDDRLSCPTAGSAPHVTISTSHGEIVCLSEETMDDIDVGLIDDMAVLQMQSLTNLMVYLAKKAKRNRSH